MWRSTLAAGFLMLWAGSAAAIDRVVLEVGALSVGGLQMANATAELDLTDDTPSFKSSRVAIAGGHVQVTGKPGPQGWSVTGRAQALQIEQVRKLIAPWFSFPATYSVTGRVEVIAEALGRIGAMRLKLDAQARDLDFTNEAGTVVAEKVAAQLGATVWQDKALELEGELACTSGQTLAGPVLLDFAANPLQLKTKGRMADGLLELSRLDVAQKNLLTARGAAQLHPGSAPFVKHAQLKVSSVQFPAAYTSFLQIALAATDFGTLQASGTARGGVEITDDALGSVNIEIDDLDLEDPQTQFSMSDLRGALRWVPGAEATVEPSWIAWSKAQAYGLKGGTAQLDFRASGSGFELTRESRVPIFDGAVVVHSMAARNLIGADAAELDFDAHIEPISMPLLSKAFGWPELSGQLAGRIPGLTYRNGLLALNGDLTANVFDGTITGSRFRLREPLGPWPRLYADITARRLDLELVTSTFSIGSITGRLDADMKGLELFNWSPVAFDARLYSTPSDRSPKLISQKAVTSISSIGGGSGGVTKALQSGVLRFFDRFRYDRIGINCQLRNDVCLMTGVEPRGEGYYIVKGWGIPRIDIIGNAGRVDWPQLMTQIIQGMRSENVIVH